MQYSPSSNRAHLDHEALHQNALEIRNSLSEDSSSEPGSGRRSLLELFDEFCHRVNRHFDVEEQAWSVTGEIDWTSRARIDALIREHEDLRARFTASRKALLDAQEHGGPLAPERVAEIREILDDLLRHELSEAGLLQSQILSECPLPRWQDRG